MSGAPVPADESARLMALAYYGILDTPPEMRFDRITRLAAQLLGTPVAVLNFVDQFRQWSKSSVGLSGDTAPREDSFCAWTILQEQPTVIPDAHTDPRFAGNPMVTGEPNIHMYAGAPLVMQSGQRIGTLCVTDDKPHPLSADDLQALQDLAALAVTELELRAYQQRLSVSLAAQQEHSQELQRSLDQAQVLDGIHQLLELDLDVHNTLLGVAALLGDAMDADHAGLISAANDTLCMEVSHVHPRVPAPQQAVASGAPETARALGLHLIPTTTFIENLPAHAAALGVPVSGHVAQIAAVPVGTDGEGHDLLLMVSRLTGTAHATWRARDRSLFEAVGRAVRHSLDRRQAQSWARRDPLTGVFNRRALDHDLTETGPMPFTLAMLDIDGMKAVNDCEGHVQGDRLLRVFAASLAAQVGPAGRVYRYGGDEFVIVCDLMTEDRLLEAVDQAVLSARQTSEQVGASVGVTHSHEGSPAELLTLADARMYEVKRRRRALRV